MTQYEKKEGKREEQRREGKKAERGMMKSSFMLYILCMKISDPESRCYCDGRRKEDPRLSPLACASLHSLWIHIAPELPETAVIPTVCGLHRVKLARRWGARRLEGAGKPKVTLRTRASVCKV